MGANHTFAEMFEFMADLMIYYKGATEALQTKLDNQTPDLFTFVAECPKPCIPPGPCKYTLKGDARPPDRSFEEDIHNLENTFDKVIKDARLLIARASKEGVDTWDYRPSKNPCPDAKD